MSNDWTASTTIVAATLLFAIVFLLGYLALGAAASGVCHLTY